MSSAERILEAIRYDVVIYRQAVNIGVAVIVRPRWHADEQRIFSAAIVMGMIDTGWNDHQVPIQRASKYLVNQTMRRRIDSRIVQHNSDFAPTDEDSVIVQPMNMPAFHFTRPDRELIHVNERR